MVSILSCVTCVSLHRLQRPKASSSPVGCVMSSYCKVHCKILPECARNTPKTVQGCLGKSMKIGSGRGFRRIMRPSL